MKKDNIDQAATKKLAGDLQIAFVWHETPEGQDYWQEVQSRMQALARAKIESD